MVYPHPAPWQRIHSSPAAAAGSQPDCQQSTRPPSAHRHLIFRLILSVSGQTNQICAAALAFQHIADGLFVQFTLCQYADDECSLLNEADRAVLQLARNVCLGVDVADLFQLQAPFQANRIVNAATHEKHIVRISILCCKPLNELFVFQNLLHLLRNGQQLRDIITVLLFRNLLSDLCKLNSQAIHRSQLCAVSLCCGDRDFWASEGVEHLVRFAGNATAHHVDNSQCEHQNYDQILSVPQLHCPKPTM